MNVPLLVSVFTVLIITWALLLAYGRFRKVVLSDESEYEYFPWATIAAVCMAVLASAPMVNYVKRNQRKPRRKSERRSA